MLKKYTNEEYWKLYEELPEKIKKTFWEDDISNRIENMAERHNLDSEKMSKVTQITTHLLLGVLPPSQIDSVIKKEVAFDEDKSKALSNEFKRSIIYPMQHLLREIYTEEDFKEAGIKPISEKEEKEEKKPSEFGDIYREPIE